MKFSTNLKKISEVIKNAVSILPSKSIDLRFETISLSIKGKELSIFTDGGDISYLKKIEVDVDTEGEFRSDAKWLYQILSQLDVEVVQFELSSEDSRINIKTSKGQYKLPCYEPFTYTHKKSDVDASFSITAKDLKRISEKTLFCVSQDTMRPGMTGVLFKIEGTELHAVATDAHRLIKFNKKLSKKISKSVEIIIPPRTMQSVQKVFDENLEQEVVVEISSTTNKIYFTCDNVQISSNLISDKYPNYSTVIPLENDKKMIIKKSEMEKSVKRVSMFSSSLKYILFSLSNGSIEITAENVERNGEGKENILCDYVNDHLQIGFNSDAVIQALAHVDNDTCSFEFSTPIRACIIKPIQNSEGEDILMLIMPVRINNVA